MCGPADIITQDFRAADPRDASPEWFAPSAYAIGSAVRGIRGMVFCRPGAVEAAQAATTPQPITATDEPAAKPKRTPPAEVTLDKLIPSDMVSSLLANGDASVSRTFVRLLASYIKQPAPMALFTEAATGKTAKELAKFIKSTAVSELGSSLQADKVASMTVYGTSCKDLKFETLGAFPLEFSVRSYMVAAPALDNAIKQRAVKDIAADLSKTLKRKRRWALKDQAAAAVASGSIRLLNPSDASDAPERNIGFIAPTRDQFIALGIFPPLAEWLNGDGWRTITAKLCKALAEGKSEEAEEGEE
jgi:hypothetical protein